MRILFLGYRYSYYRNFDSVLRDLANRGHEIHLAVEQDHDQGLALVASLSAECPTLTFGVAPSHADDQVNWIVGRVRHGLDHLRYQHQAFDDAPMLRERSRERTPGLFVAIGTFVRRYARWARRPLAACLRWIERSAPVDQAIRSFIEQQRPDVVLITPLVTLGSSQADYLRAAQSCGVPTAVCVWSWDHLSSKAIIRELPDRLFVWNETQKGEAIDMHGMPPGHIVVTGAQCFDRWFDRQPSRDRERFCRDAALPSAQPFLLYVCSAPFAGSEPEAPFVVEWVRRVRAHESPRLRDAPILIRPHPSRRVEWDTIDLSELTGVSVWGGDPVDTQARADYFDSLFHSAVVVGLNTSAFIEAGIVGRPVFTLLMPQWHESQRGTLHFRYLLEEHGGLLRSAATFETHLRQVDEALSQENRDRHHPFVRAFVRPHGLDVAATPLFVKHVEEMRAVTVDMPREPRLAGLARRMLRAGAERQDDVRWERWLYSARELEAIVRNRAARQVKADRDAEIKRERVANKAVRAAARRIERDQQREAKRRLSS